MFKCKISNKCGSCQLLDKEYDETLKIKLNHVNKLFKENKINYQIKEIFPSPNMIKYRNKMIVGFKYSNNEIIAGFYEENSHKIIAMESCLMHSDIQNKIVQETIKIMKQLKLRPYDEDRKVGLIRYLVIKEGFNTNEIMIVVVTGQEVFPGSNEFCKRIRSIDKNIKTIVQNINMRKTSIVLGEKEKILFGPGYISDYICGLKFNITSKSFFQVNPLQAERLYKKVIEFAEFSKNDVVIDAYSGVGTIGMTFSSKVKNVISVENNKQAHIAAINNAKTNNIKNVKFYNDDATNFIKDLAANKEKIDVIIMDPPRTGSTEEFIMSCVKLSPKKIVYVSCGPDTLARDLKVFLKNKYQISKACCYDMFCFSNHVETIVTLVLDDKVK